MKHITGRRCMFEDITEWYSGYQKHKAQIASIKEELLPIDWHPSRSWDWCVPEDEKNKQKIFF